MMRIDASTRCGLRSSKTGIAERLRGWQRWIGSRRRYFAWRGFVWAVSFTTSTCHTGLPYRCPANWLKACQLMLARVGCAFAGQ